MAPQPQRKPYKHQALNTLNPKPLTPWQTLNPKAPGLKLPEAGPPTPTRAVAEMQTPPPQTARFRGLRHRVYKDEYRLRV